MTGKYHDRFSQAFDELNDKNAFVCHSCGSTNIGRAAESDLGKKERDLGKKEPVSVEENASLHIAKTKTEKAIYSDPSPLGP